jgi:hypothetical protein
VQCIVRGSVDLCFVLFWAGIRGEKMKLKFKMDRAEQRKELGTQNKQAKQGRGIITNLERALLISFLQAMPAKES